MYSTQAFQRIMKPTPAHQLPPLDRVSTLESLRCPFPSHPYFFKVPLNNLKPGVGGILIIFLFFLGSFTPKVCIPK